MAILKKLSDFATATAASAKSVVKLVVQSRRCTISHADDPSRPIIIMGNGPSLADTMRDFAPTLLSHPLMAVNFAANADDFYRFRPRYYVLADPAFFAADPYENVVTLWHNINSRIDWPMTLFVPAQCRRRVESLLGSDKSNITVECFNMIGIEGYEWLENMAYTSGLGMPRPRNVLIVSIMVALKLGYKQIFITGADHSWTRTLEVSEDNLVVTVQPHFYKDNEAEHSRVASVYKDIRLHQILHSFYVAFRSYFTIERYARHRGVDIFNATPGSFIDAFRRRSLKTLIPGSTDNRGECPAGIDAETAG